MEDGVLSGVPGECGFLDGEVNGEERADGCRILLQCRMRSEVRRND